MISFVPIASRSTLNSFLLIRIGLLAKTMQTSSIITTLSGCSGIKKRRLLQRRQGVPNIENGKPSPYRCLLEAHLTRSIQRPRGITVNPLAAITTSTPQLGMLANLPVFCIAADREGVGNMVLLSYKTNEPKNSCYKSGAYMFSMRQYFFELVRAELYPKINLGFENKNPDYFTDGHPDIMKALIHVLIEDGVDGQAHYKTCRLVPSMGTRLQTWPAMHSSRDFENPDPLTKTKQFCRTDLGIWKGKNTVSGLLIGAVFKEKKAPQLYSLAVVGKSKWYCSIETDLNKVGDWKHCHKTFIEPKYFIPGNAGDDTGLLKLVDAENRMTYGLAIESFDLTPMKDLSTFAKKKRRRNRRIQLEGRTFTANYDEACDIVFLLALAY